MHSVKFWMHETEQAIFITTVKGIGLTVPERRNGAKEFGRRIGTKEEAFFIGDDKGKPTGILNATDGASGGVTMATANITFDDVMDLFCSLKAPYSRSQRQWMQRQKDRDEGG